MDRKPCSNNVIHVQIMKFMLCFEYNFYLKILTTGHHLFTWRYTTLRCCPGTGILSWFLLTSNSVQFSWNDVLIYGIPTARNSVESHQNARIAITHVCFIALTFAKSLGRCLNTQPAASCSNSFLRTWQMLMHQKKRVIPILRSLKLCTIFFKMALITAILTPRSFST